MNDGTSSIRLAGTAPRSRSPSRLSLRMLSETLAPSAGQTCETASSNWPASGVASGRSGNTVSRVAVTARFLSMKGE